MRRSVEKGNALQQSTQCGEVSEWSKEHAWKVCKSKGFEGSNPSLSAKNIEKPAAYGWFSVLPTIQPAINETLISY